MHRPHHLEVGRPPIQEKEDAGLSSEEMVRREDPLVAEPVRRLLVTWEEKKKSYVGMLHFACA